MEFVSVPKECQRGQAYVRGVLNGGLIKRLFHKAVQLKPELPWRTQDVREARIVCYLPRRAANRERNEPKRKM